MPSFSGDGWPHLASQELDLQWSSGSCLPGSLKLCREAHGHILSGLVNSRSLEPPRILWHFILNLCLALRSMLSIFLEYSFWNLYLVCWLENNIGRNKGDKSISPSCSEKLLFHLAPIWFPDKLGVISVFVYLSLFIL